MPGSTTLCVSLPCCIYRLALLVSCLLSCAANHRSLTSRSIIDSKSHESNLQWTHSEMLDTNGDYILRWLPGDSSISFRVEARTLGYIGIGFSSQSIMKGADLVLTWVDDRTGNAQLLDCHGAADGSDTPVTDDTQNYELISGFQNKTHTIVEFKRSLDTCDPEDYVIGSDTVKVLWSIGSRDPAASGLLKHDRKGVHPLRLLAPRPVRPDPSEDVMTWDIRLSNLVIPDNMATLFWCKIFKPPANTKTKHHIIGYEPLIDSRPMPSMMGETPAHVDSPVQHMVLYECAGTVDADAHMWDEWADGEGFFGPEMPREWAACIAPVAVWAIGSKGEFLPGNVGIPLSANGPTAYYMMEVHYDNPSLHKILDNSGMRLHYAKTLRKHDAAILVSGVTVSALHVVPPAQQNYITAGYCADQCTRAVFPADGINIVSALLHSHSAGKKLSLRHIRDGLELPKLAEDNHYDYRNQQSRILAEPRKVLPGDSLITECAYSTKARTKPTMGGYSAQQEMCLSFLLYYPRVPLAGCYSMTPVKEFFETFGVREFYDSDMKKVENMFLASGSLEAFPELSELATAGKEGEPKDFAIQGDDQGVGLLSQLVIRDPPEFRNKTFMAHLNEIPWTEPLLTKRIEDALYKGKHMTFCKKRDDSLAVPIEIQMYPKYQELPEEEITKPCRFNIAQGTKYKMSGSPMNHSAISIFTCLLSTFVLMILH